MPGPVSDGVDRRREGAAMAAAAVGLVIGFLAAPAWKFIVGVLTALAAASVVGTAVDRF